MRFGRPTGSYTWFAWYPVRLRNGQWAWLEHVTIYKQVTTGGHFEVGYDVDDEN